MPIVTTTFTASGLNEMILFLLDSQPNGYILDLKRDEGVHYGWLEITSAGKAGSQKLKWEW